MPSVKRVKKRCMIAHHCSTSIECARSIDPFTSANITVTCLRSCSLAPSGTCGIAPGGIVAPGGTTGIDLDVPIGGANAASAPRAEAPTEAPHRLQCLASGGLLCPQ